MQSIFPRTWEHTSPPEKNTTISDGFPVGFFWYEGRSAGPGHPPEWVDKLLAETCHQRQVIMQTHSNVDLSLGDPTKNVLIPDHAKNCDEEDKEDSSDGVDN